MMTLNLNEQLQAHFVMIPTKYKSKNLQRHYHVLIPMQDFMTFSSYLFGLILKIIKILIRSSPGLIRLMIK